MLDIEAFAVVNFLTCIPIGKLFVCVIITREAVFAWVIILEVYTDFVSVAYVFGDVLRLGYFGT